MVARYEPDGIVRTGTVRRHGCVIGVAVCRGYQLVQPLHFLAHRRIPENSVCIQLHPHRLRIEIIKIYMHHKYVLPLAGLNR